jgi:hypothetical protein
MADRGRKRSRGEQYDLVTQPTSLGYAGRQPVEGGSSFWISLARPTAIEKDWHILRAMGAIASIDATPLSPHSPRTQLA